MNKNYTASIPLFLVILSAFGCGSGGGSNSVNLKVFHALTNAQSIDFLLNGEREVDNLGDWLMSDWLSFEEGTKRIEVEVEGLLTPVIDTNVSFSVEQKYTVYVVGTVAEPSIFVQRDSLNDGPQSGELFRLRIVDLSVQNNLYDVYLLPKSSVFSTGFQIGSA